MFRAAPKGNRKRRERGEKRVEWMKGEGTQGREEAGSKRRSNLTGGRGSPRFRRLIADEKLSRGKTEEEEEEEDARD